MLMPATKKKSRRNLFIVLGVIVVVVIAMVLSTKFLTPEELAAVGPKKFDPAQTANELWTKAQTEVPANAQPLGQVVPAMQKDLEAAATKYKAESPAEGAYAFPVEFDGTVEEASDASLRISRTWSARGDGGHHSLDHGHQRHRCPRRYGLQVR